MEAVHGMVVKIMGSGTRMSGFKSWLCYLLVVWLNLNFYIYEMEMY